MAGLQRELVVASPFWMTESAGGRLDLQAKLTGPNAFGTRSALESHLHHVVAAHVVATRVVTARAAAALAASATSAAARSLTRSTTSHFFYT